nr:nephrin-like [Penaeus vannamei]
MSADPPGLVLNPVKAADHAEYRCRVDFRSSPTQNVRVQLEVIVPPKRIRIKSEVGMEVSGVIGPYPVGASVALVCEVESGRPRPSVSWFHEESLLDNVSEVKRGEVTTNTLTIAALTRADLYRVLTCQASNSNLSTPVAATVTLDMSFPPLDVRILGAMESLSEGERYEIVCESSGSRPTATISWWKNGMLMTDTKTEYLQDLIELCRRSQGPATLARRRARSKHITRFKQECSNILGSAGGSEANTAEEVFHEGNVSRSTLYLTPSVADHDTYVSCRAKNPLVPSAVLEDSKKLNVHYTPRLTLAPGQNLDMEDIEESDDVYFECGIQANPRVYKVQWFHNGEELYHNVSAGIIQSNQSLVLQKVTRKSSGQYTCSATNLHGTGGSNAPCSSV